MNTPVPVPPAGGASIDAGRLKHLEMIQAVISRMAGNSFLIKGWSVTLMAAILALAVKDKVYPMIWVAFVPCVMFWLLDGFFLRQERLFRQLWNARRVEPQDGPTDFDMNTSAFEGQVASWLGIMFSKTLRMFHGCLFAVLVLVTVLMRCIVF